MEARTSLDLALDLAAQKQRLYQQQQELQMLRNLKQQLYQAASEGTTSESSSWLHSPETRRNLSLLVRA